jgi:citrate lyase subunit beta/citryl-CoA lyase
MAASDITPRRACLVVPGSSERMLAKARGIEVDEIVIDLEDGVAPDAKDAAREQMLAALARGGFAAPTVSVRVNAAGTSWAAGDLAALAGSSVRPATVVVPKVESADDVAAVAKQLPESIAIQAQIETALGLRDVDVIATASQRLEALVLGYADLASSLGRSRAATARPGIWLAAQDRVLVAARAAGVQAIDGPFVAVDDIRVLRVGAHHAADLGFDGKWAIHPSQVDVLTEAFTPANDEIARARGVLAALDGGAAQGCGAVRLDGEMVDEAMRAGALRTLTRAGEL